MGNYEKLLEELKDSKIEELNKKYEIELNKKYEIELNNIKAKSYESLGELLYYNKNLLKKYPENNEEFIKYFVENRINYDEREFYLNEKKVMKEEFFEIIKGKEFEMELDLQSYTEQIFVTLLKDRLEVYYYIGD